MRHGTNLKVFLCLLLLSLTIIGCYCMRSLFMANCQKCHPGGEGGLGPSINANPALAFMKRFQTRHGLGTMPSFTKTEISKKDLHDITAYLKAWKKN